MARHTTPFTTRNCSTTTSLKEWRRMAVPIMRHSLFNGQDMRVGISLAASKREEGAMADTDQLDLKCINTIRTLSMDAVQAANSGHPGTPMALAPAAYCLWNRFLRFDPEDPIWPNR